MDEADPECLSVEAGCNEPWPFLGSPVLRYQSASNEFRMCTRGVEWSPDGSCLLCSSDDFVMRVLEPPWNDASGSLKVGLRVSIGESINDFHWFPSVVSPCFVTCARALPLQLWDGFSGELRASYVGMDGKDEVDPTVCVAISSDGERFYCGFRKGTIRCFDVSYSGRSSTELKTLGLRGIVSCIALGTLPSGQSVVVAGTFSNTMGIYDVDGSGGVTWEVPGRGIHRILFNESLLFVSVRRGPILCYDLRMFDIDDIASGNPPVPYCSFERPADTTQRIGFCVSSLFGTLLAAGTDGSIHLFDAAKRRGIMQFELHDDAINDIGLHPNGAFLAASTGQRHFSSIFNEDSTNDKARKPCDCVSVWNLSDKSSLSVSP